MSPYLSDDQRLGEVIASIQAMGTYKFYKLDFAGWADRICGDASKADHWKDVFAEHPEFFRLDSKREKASLILRRQRQRLFNVDDESVWSREKYEALAPASQTRFSRSPLSPSEIEALVDVAINLHSRAAERVRDRRWWLLLGVPFVGALAGGLIPKLLTSAPCT